MEKISDLEDKLENLEEDKKLINKVKNENESLKKQVEKLSNMNVI